MATDEIWAINFLRIQFLLQERNRPIFPFGLFRHLLGRLDHDQPNYSVAKLDLCNHQGSYHCHHHIAVVSIFWLPKSQGNYLL